MEYNIEGKRGSQQQKRKVRDEVTIEDGGESADWNNKVKAK
jgi:hypothetical protein